MKWIACLRTGEQIHEGIETGFNDLDKSLVEKFVLVEDNDNFVPFDNSTGVFRFNNLDIRKFDEMADGQKLIMEFDKKLGIFKLTKSSLKALKGIQSPEEFAYKLGFDCYGNIEVDSHKLVLGIEVGKLYTFNSNRFKNLIQFKDGYSDVKMSNDTAINKVSRTSAYTIGFETDYEIDGINFSISCILEYNLVSQSVVLKYTVVSDKDVTAKIYFNYDGTERFIPVHLTKSSPMQTKKVLDLLK